MKICSPALTPLQIAAVEGTKEWVRECIRRRDEGAGVHSTFNPTPYWQFFAQAFNYLLALPAEEYRSLRLHTYHLDGETYQRAFFASRTEYEVPYRALIRHLPASYHLSAPEACGEYGHIVDGRLVNGAVLRWQELIGTLYGRGILERLASKRRPIILEIGGGWGSLGEHFQRIFPDLIYIIVDIPETLLFSTSYLTLLHGQTRVRKEAGDSKLSLNSLAEASFLMLPNYALGAISDLNFDLTINIQSFQEMTADQVRQYLEFLAPRTSILLSDNQDKQDVSEQDICVSALLGKSFNLDPLPLRQGFVRSIINNTIAAVAFLRGQPVARPLKRYLASPAKIAR